MASASLSGFSMTGWNANSFRPQLPLAPVTYPPCCGKGLNMRYFMQSKIMALAFLILGIAFLVSFVCCFLPFWFFLKFNIFDSTFGSEGLRQHDKDLGIFFYTGDDFVNLLYLEKMSNRQVVPRLFKMAQLMEMLSVTTLFCAFAGSGILAFRRFSSVTGALFLAALGTVAAVGQILMAVFASLSMTLSDNDICEPAQMDCMYTQNSVWRNLPFNEQHRRINPHTTPMMAANWGLYIAFIGAVLSVVGCVLLWLEGLSVCRSVTRIRYQQLSQKRDVYEHERDPTSYIDSTPRRHGGGGGYDRGGPPPGMYATGPQYAAAPRQTYRPPPSFSGSSMQSGSMPPYVSKEIDL